MLSQYRLKSNGGNDVDRHPDPPPASPVAPAGRSRRAASPTAPRGCGRRGPRSGCPSVVVSLPDRPEVSWRYPGICVPCRCRPAWPSLSRSSPCGGGIEAHAEKRTVCTITVNSRRRAGSLPAAPAGRRLRVRRAGGARPSRLARFGLQAGRALRSPCHFRPFRWHDRVLLRPAGAARIAAGCRDGTRLVQRFLSRRVLAVEGGLSLRLQHDERGTAHEHVRRSRAKPDALRIHAGRCAAADARSRPAARREQPRSHAPHLHERSRDLRLLPARAARTDRRDAAQPLLRFGVPSRRRQRPSGSPAPRAIRGEHDGRAERLDRGRPDAEFRRETCRFVDERLSPAAKLAFVHDLLRRDMAEARMFLDRIERLYASFTDSERHTPSFVEAQGEIARDARRARALPALCRGRRPRPHRAPG